MKIFLDTDICIAILRKKDPALETRLQNIPISSVALSSVVVAELWVGVEKSQHPENAKSKLLIFLRDIPTIPFDENGARKYGEIRATLEKRGLSIGANDLLIAATALDHDGKLITRNQREYERVPGLQVEVW